MLRDWWNWTRAESSSSQPRRRSAEPRPAKYFRPRLEEIEPRILLSGTWIPLLNQAPAPIGTTILLPDGTVMGLEVDDIHWDRLTPDRTGSYVNGTWSPMAPMSMERLYFASKVLPDNRV